MDLSNQSAIGSTLLVKVEVPGEPVTTFSTHWKSLTIDGTVYTGLGNFVSITETATNIRATAQDLSIVISGIPVTNQTFADNNLLKGSPISVYRYVFNPVTGEALSGIGSNPSGRFFGIVSNCNIDFSSDPVNRTATSTILLQCSSIVETLENKVAGRRTTPEDMKKYFPGDQSFDRVSSLARSNFNFGAPK